MRASRTLSSCVRAAGLLLAALCLIFLHAPSRTCQAQTGGAATSAAPQTPSGAKPARGAEEATRREPDSPVGSISGRVVGEGGEPLSNVLITLLPKVSTVSFRLQQSATTDEEGNFVLSGLDPGIYGVGAYSPGYVSEADAQAGRYSGSYRLGDTVTLRMIKGGVITGTVADAGGGPVIALSVRAYRVRDLEGRPPPASSSYYAEGQTDDRGVYRIYGLMPGAYVVVAGGFSPGGWGAVSAYEGDVPVFYPSGTRETASEVVVRAGEEVGGVDIRYREMRGHRVAGTVPFPQAEQGQDFGVGVTLTHADSGIQAGSAAVSPRDEGRAFSFDSVADGEYDLRAVYSTRQGVTSVAPPQRVTVRGADVTGLKLTLTPLASLSGTLVIEPAGEAERSREDCKGRRAGALPQETLVVALRDEAQTPKGQPRTRAFRRSETSPDSSGAFTLRNLEQGRYRVEVRPLDENLYVRSVALPGATKPPETPKPAAPGVPVAEPRDSLLLTPGQQLSGLAVRLAEGAAGASGHIVPQEAGAASPASGLVRIYLVPAEREHADNFWRFAEATPSGDGAFSFKNVPPGRYFVVARATSGEPSDAPPRPAFWDATDRAKLRREAEAADFSLNLQPCQRAGDITLRVTK